MKVCYRCKINKELFEYQRDNASKDGYRATCKKCRAKRMKATYTREHAKTKNIKFKYGISQAQYDELVMVQCGVCYICGNNETRTHHLTGEIYQLAVHHDHSTGKVIALLCSACNRGIGLLKDSAVLLSRAAEMQANNERND
jgi:hypothetical protein